MPRLVRGGKYVYGWSEASSEGRIVVPDEALADYNLRPPCKVILLSGSKRSGGFAITTIALIRNSSLSVILDENPQLFGFQLPEGEIMTIAGKPYCWVTLDRDGKITLPLETMKGYGVHPRDLLLLVRGSHLALGFCAKGPLVDEAKKHASLAILKG